MEFIAGMLFTWPVLVLLGIIAILTEHKDRSGWAAIFAIGFVAVVYVIFDITWQNLLLIAAAYIPIGIVWSIFRFRRFCDFVVAETKRTNGNRDAAKRKVEMSNNMDNIVYWAAAWPFSFLSSILGDLIDVMDSLIRNLFGKTFAKISQAAQGKIDNI